MGASRVGGSILEVVHPLSSLSYKNPGQLFLCKGFASNLLVKGISFSTMEDGLDNSFSQFGEVVEAKVIRDKVRNRSKGYGYVTFAKEDETTKAVTVMNGQLIDGCAIFIDKVQPRSTPKNPSQGADE